MRRHEFLAALRKELDALPKAELEERLSFYSEMIDDRMEEGFSEEEAVAQIGSVEDVVAQVVAEIPLSKLVKEKIKGRKKWEVWKTILLILGFPLWFSLLIAAFAVVFSLYIVSWSLVVCLWAVFIAFAVSGVCAVGAGVVCIAYGNVLPGLAAIAGGMVCAGLSIFLFYGCKAATKGIALLTKKIVLGVKNRFI